MVTIRLKQLRQMEVSEDDLYEIGEDVDLPKLFVLTTGYKCLHLHSKEDWDDVCQKTLALPEEDVRDALYRNRFAPSQEIQITNQQIRISYALLRLGNIAVCDLVLMYQNGRGTLSPIK